MRELRADVPLLAQSFVKEFAEENGKKVSEFTPDAMETLMNFAWPGNVRELRTAMEHAGVLCRGERITTRDLPPTVRGLKPAAAAARPSQGGLTAGNLTVKEAEKNLIVRALKETASNRTAAARKLGMSRRTLHRKLHAYHLEGF